MKNRRAVSGTAETYDMRDKNQRREPGGKRRGDGATLVTRASPEAGKQMGENKKNKKKVR